MFRIVSFIVVTVFLVGCGDMSSNQSQSNFDSNATNISTDSELNRMAIYGEDDRIFVGFTEHERKMKSIAGMLNSTQLQTEGEIAIYDETVGEMNNLCWGQKYHPFPVVASCTTTLIAPNVLLTAGHCVPSRSFCRSKKFAFNISPKNSNGDVFNLENDGTYSCKNLLYSQNDDGGDIALIRLDRNSNRPFLPVNLKTKVSVPSDTSLYSIGHSEGMPLMLSRNGTSKGYDGSFLMHSLDTFAGNSGSPVFKNNKIFGVHAKRGFNHYWSDGDCYRRQTAEDDPERYGRTPETFYAKATNTSVLRKVFRNDVVALVGGIQNVTVDGDEMIVSGWACSLTRTDKVSYDVYHPNGNRVKSGVANKKLNNQITKKINNICQSNQQDHAFKFRVPSSRFVNVELQHLGQSYVMKAKRP